ncbi:MAG: hypothetical protein ACXWJW_09025 [Xanthobacteraceae bacterium]
MGQGRAFDPAMPMFLTIIFRRVIAAPAALLALVMLANCGEGSRSQYEQEREASLNVFPTNYKPELLAYFHVYLNDPTGVRDAAISDPVIKPVGPRDRYIVCVRFNAKRLSGEYAGVKNGIALFRNGRFDQFTEQPRETKDVCGQAEYKPFPELEKLTR